MAKPSRLSAVHHTAGGRTPAAPPRGVSISRIFTPPTTTTSTTIRRGAARLPYPSQPARTTPSLTACTHRGSHPTTACTARTTRTAVSTALALPRLPAKHNRVAALPTCRPASTAPARRRRTTSTTTNALRGARTTTAPAQRCCRLPPSNSQRGSSTSPQRAARRAPNNEHQHQHQHHGRRSWMHSGLGCCYCFCRPSLRVPCCHCWLRRGGRAATGWR
jgi:hypothetical protein